MVAPEELCTIPCSNAEVVAWAKGQMPTEDVLEDTRVLFATLASDGQMPCGGG